MGPRGTRTHNPRIKSAIVRAMLGILRRHDPVRESAASRERSTAYAMPCRRPARSSKATPRARRGPNFHGPAAEMRISTKCKIRPSLRPLSTLSGRAGAGMSVWNRPSSIGAVCARSAEESPWRRSAGHGIGIGRSRGCRLDGPVCWPPAFRRSAVFCWLSGIVISLGVQPVGD